MKVKEVSDTIYDSLGHAYCDNCRADPFNDDEEGHCEYCHRKNIGWAVSRYVCDQIAEKICGGITQ